MRPLAGHSALTLEEATGAFAELDWPTASPPTEEIVMDWEDDEKTDPCWRIPEVEMQHRRPTLPTLVAVDWETVK